MAKFMDLPLEIRTQIYRLLIDWDIAFRFGPMDFLTKLCNINPSILQVNKTISYEAGLTFYRDNPAEVWIEVDHDKRDTIDGIVGAVLGALTDKNAVPHSWQCCVTVHVSYGDTESEFYHSQLILHEKQAKYPALSGAPSGKAILDGWRQWFSGGKWRISSLWVSRSRYAWVNGSMQDLCTRRGRAWRVGDVISGDDFVKYLERLLPSPLKGKDLL
ncbi:MAG: hypothetical protein Q9195_004736 [Heterodermia aff. obscurata]